MYQQVLHILMSLPVCYQDRHLPTDVKAGQLQTVASAIASEAVDKSEAAYLVSIAWHESRLCLATHAGRHPGRGRGLYQIERASGAPSAGTGYVGLSLPETVNATRAALHMLRHSYQCGQRPRDRFTAYAGRPCGLVWPTMLSRERMYYYLLGRPQWSES